METLIRFVLGNLTVLMFPAAFVAAAVSKRPAPYEERLLDWLLLLFLGIGSIWSGIFHVFFPAIASKSIGWSPSPFETEIGIADIAMGITAIVAFWRPVQFKGAIILYAVVFFIGVAINHVYDAAAGNLAVNNFGLLLVSTIVSIFLLPWLYFRAQSREAAR
ncbi:DUF6790 family protein [Bosea sp. RAF48]|uniref:DUF6790 family protein n=1 Tax=Bosea sp. RAF48 TaxID=3237480 RepID=UPI003F8EBE3E